jgi:predicted RNase H-like HicB family nuclease
MGLRYHATVTRERDRYLASFIDAPGCQTFADSEEELRIAAREALVGWLEAHLAAEDAPPAPFVDAPAGALAVDVPDALAEDLETFWASQGGG